MPLHAAQLKHSTLVSFWVTRVRGCLDHQRTGKDCLLSSIRNIC